MMGRASFESLILCREDRHWIPKGLFIMSW
jgi:hypothetical protein